MLFALLFLLLACRTENLIEENHSDDYDSRIQLTSKKISLNEAKHKLKLVTELTKAKDLLSNIKSDASGKTVNYGNGFTINTDKVLYIESDTNHYSYTFNIQRDNKLENEPLENLVLSPLADGTYKELLVSYNLTPQEKHTLLIGGTIDTRDKVTVTELTKGTVRDNEQLGKTITGSTCGYEEEQVWISCSEHVHDQNNVPDWLECEAERPPSMYTIITWKCHYTTDVGTPGNPGGGNGGYPRGGTGEPGTPTQPIEISSFPIFVKNLQPDLKTIINNAANAEFKSGLQGYYDASYGSNEAQIFITWAIQFKADNPSTTWTLFENWFMGTPEGNDGGIEFNIDDYNGVQVQTYASLPGRNAFYDAFPKDGTKGMVNTAVYQLVGGNLYNLHQTYPSTYWNACAIRVSRALNYSGHPLPIFKNKTGQQRTEKGGDGKNYILDAASMLAYMLKAYPNNPPLHLKNKTPEQYLQALEGKWGIYIMLPKPSANFGATGHADFFSFSGCLSNCYFQSAKEIYFWELN